MTLAAPMKMSRLVCARSIISATGVNVDGDTCIMVKLSTKQCPNSLNVLVSRQPFILKSHLILVNFVLHQF